MLRAIMYWSALGLTCAIFLSCLVLQVTMPEWQDFTIILMVLSVTGIAVFALSSPPRRCPVCVSWNTEWIFFDIHPKYMVWCKSCEKFQFFARHNHATKGN